MSTYQLLRRSIRLGETLTASFIVLSALYLLSLPIIGKEYAPGDDIFIMVVFVLGWLGGLTLAVAVLVRSVQRRR